MALLNTLIAAFKTLIAALNDNSGAINAIAVVALVIVTYKYVKLTANLVRNQERRNRRELVEKKLEKLYSPLYSYINREEFGESFPEMPLSKTIRELIDNNIHLASDNLHPLLHDWILNIDSGLLVIEKDYANKILKTIHNEWEELRKELLLIQNNK